MGGRPAVPPAYHHPPQPSRAPRRPWHNPPSQTLCCGGPRPGAPPSGVTHRCWGRGSAGRRSAPSIPFPTSPARRSPHLYGSYHFAGGGLLRVGAGRPCRNSPPSQCRRCPPFLHDASGISGGGLPCLPLPSTAAGPGGTPLGAVPHQAVGTRCDKNTLAYAVPFPARPPPGPAPQQPPYQPPAGEALCRGGDPRQAQAGATAAAPRPPAPARRGVAGAVTARRPPPAFGLWGTRDIRCLHPPQLPTHKCPINFGLGLPCTVDKWQRQRAGLAK